MKKIIILLMLTSPAFAESTRDVRDNFTNLAKGRETKFAYAHPITGECVVENYVTKIGQYDRRKDVEKLTVSALGNTSDHLTGLGAGLAAEHFWMSFELLMKAQRELATCVGAVNFAHDILGVPHIDAEGQPWAEPLVAIKEYWIEFNVTDNYFEWPAGERTYIEHFRFGISGVATAVDWRDWCRNYRNYLAYAYFGAISQ